MSRQTQWARDVVAERAASIGSVANLLTATTRVMVVGMDADPIGVQVSTISLDVVEIEIGTLTAADGDAATATVISTTIAVGAATDNKQTRVGRVAP